MNLRERRIEQEAAVLRHAFPDLLVAPDHAWVAIPDFRLPTGWEPAETTVLLVPPGNYPEAGPEGFYLGARLRRRTAGGLEEPGHYFDSYHNPYAKEGYYWYCLEDQDGSWDPRLDSLITFVEAIRTYLAAPD